MRIIVTILCSILFAMALNAASPCHRGSSSTTIPGKDGMALTVADNTLHTQSLAYTKKAGIRSIFHKEVLSAATAKSEIQRSILTKSGETLYKVNMDLIESEGYSLLGYGLGRPSLTYWEDAYDGIKLPAAEYCIVAVFGPEEDGKPSRIIIKNINLNADTTLTIDGNKATERVSFQPLLPNGVPVEGAKLNEYWEVKQPGNISAESNGYVNGGLYSPKWGLFYYYETTFGSLIDPDTHQEVDLSEGANFLFNPDATGDFIASQYCSFFGADNKSCYLLQLNSNGIKAQTVKNDLNDYNTTNYSEIMTTQYYLSGQNLIEEKNMIFGWYMVVNGMTEYMEYATGDIVNNATTLFYSIPEINSSVPSYTLFPFVDDYDYGIPENNGEFEFVPVYRITPSAFRFENGNMKSLVAPMLDGTYNSTYFFTENGVSTELVLNGAPSYSFLKKQSLQVAGDNAPFLQIVDNSRPNYFGVQYLMLGRVGESPVMADQEIYGEFDGKTITVRGDDDDSKWGDYYSFWQDLNSKYNTYEGIVKFDVKSKGTIMVDGTIPSYARTENVWNFAQKEDRIAPQLTMFQFRNTDNIVTDRFDNASDGVLTLSCADFNNVSEPIYDEAGVPVGMRQFSSFNGTPDLTVEYSPFNSNDWQRLEVAEQPEDFFMPGYGSCFRGNLGSINRKGAYGWFDIRFKLADRVGNTQSVTVSPAFNIASLSGVESVRDDNEEIRVEGKNIIAPAEALIYNASGIRVGGKSLPSGIYIVSYNGIAKKCIIR